MTTNTTTSRPGRGGPRPNSGRPAVLGENERKSARLPYALIRNATRMGNGNFSDGVRVMLMVAEHVLMQPGDVAPGDVHTHYAILSDGKSALVWHGDDGWLDADAGVSVDVAYWCKLPLAPAEVSELLTGE